MIPAGFDYVAPDSLDEAIRELHENGEDAKVLAGGHSLIPLMKLRLAAPTLLVDLRRVSELRGFDANGEIRVGAMTPHAVLEDTPELGLLSRAAGTIADRQVRHRGTIGGTLAHGDPASDLPAVMLICEASVTLQGAGGQQRTVAASELFRDYLETAVEPTEVLTEVRLPAMDGWGYAYEKFNRRSEDWAMVAVSVVVKKSGDLRVSDVLNSVSVDVIGKKQRWVIHDLNGAKSYLAIVDPANAKADKHAVVQLGTTTSNASAKAHDRVAVNASESFDGAD